jgi:hypothetical protein
LSRAVWSIASRASPALALELGGGDAGPAVPEAAWWSSAVPFEAHDASPTAPRARRALRRPQDRDIALRTTRPASPGSTARGPRLIDQHLPDPSGPRVVRLGRRMNALPQGARARCGPRDADGRARWAAVRGARSGVRRRRRPRERRAALVRARERLVEDAPARGDPALEALRSLSR